MVGSCWWNSACLCILWSYNKQWSNGIIIPYVSFIHISPRHTDLRQLQGRRDKKQHEPIMIHYYSSLDHYKSLLVTFHPYCSLSITIAKGYRHYDIIVIWLRSTIVTIVAINHYQSLSIPSHWNRPALFEPKKLTLQETSFDQFRSSSSLSSPGAVCFLDRWVPSIWQCILYIFI